MAVVTDNPDAVEVIAAGPGPVVLTCEHASNRLPRPWAWPEGDAWITDTHWAWDPGAADVTRLLASRLRAHAVLARFSRLLVDPNRATSSPTLFRDLADGKAVALNTPLDDDERARRIASLYQPYHRAIDQAVAASPGALVFSVHSFTPVYEGGAPREMELGVLFDHDHGPGLRLADALARRGWRTAVNEPYSGVGGMMFAAQSHGARGGRIALEIEMRQDIAVVPERQRQLATDLAGALVDAGLIPGG